MSYSQPCLLTSCFISRDTLPEDQRNLGPVVLGEIMAEILLGKATLCKVDDVISSSYFFVGGFSIFLSTTTQGVAKTPLRSPLSFGSLWRRQDQRGFLIIKYHHSQQRRPNVVPVQEPSLWQSVLQSPKVF